MSTETPLDGSTALITGASSGIGKATAAQLAQQGANVSLVANNSEKLQTVATDLQKANNVRTVTIPTDVRDESQVEEMAKTTIETFGRLDIVVNNAGVQRMRNVEIENHSTEAFEDILQTNIAGMFFVTRATMPQLRETEGNLIFTGSFAGKYPVRFQPVYAASKWWARGFARSLESRYGSAGVGVTVVNPSEVRTNLGAPEGTPGKELYDEGEVLEPEDVAEAIVFAASRERPTTISEIDILRRDKISEL